MTNPTNTGRRARIPSKPVILPAGKGLFAVTDPQNPENKFDPTNRQWSIKVVWSPEERKKVEQLIGPLVPEALEAKRAELLDEAAREGNKIKEKAAASMTEEMPWREVISKETGEPTGELEMVFKRPAMKTVKGSAEKVPNSPPLVVDAKRNPTLRPIPNGARVVVKMATWPVYFAKDNKASIKRLLESIQVIVLPQARTPDASGFEDYDDEDGYDGTTEGTSSGEGSGAVPAGADY